MKLTRREIIRLGAGAGVSALGAWSPLLASQELTPGSLLKTTIPSSGQQVPAVGIGTVRFSGAPGSP